MLVDAEDLVMPTPITAGVDKEIIDLRRPTCDDLTVKRQCRVIFAEHNVDVCACHVAN